MNIIMEDIGNFYNYIDRYYETNIIVRFNEICEWSRRKIHKNSNDEKKWAQFIIKKNTSQWSSILGEKFIFELLFRLGKNPIKPIQKGHYIPDLETDDFIFEIKTRSWNITGTAGEKVYGVPFKYAEIPELYGKPLIIICVGYQEYEMTYGRTPLFGKKIRNIHLNILEFYKSMNISFMPCSKLIDELDTIPSF